MSLRRLKPALMLGLGMGASGMNPGLTDADVNAVLREERVETKGSRQRAEDSRLLREARAVLKGYPHYGMCDWATISGVRSGIVTLDGRVRRLSLREEYEQVVAGVPGVRHVFNRIAILPDSAYDDELRVAAAEALQKQPRLRRYCGGPFRQIHVLVEFGDVTLEGSVRSMSDRQFAENIVRSQVRAFDVVNNLSVEPVLEGVL